MTARYVRVDEKVQPCKSCGQDIFFRKMESGKMMPVSMATKESHFADCPKADFHRKSKPQSEVLGEIRDLVKELRESSEREHRLLDSAVRTMNEVSAAFGKIVSDLERIVAK